jgi:hypothetical protein
MIIPWCVCGRFVCRFLRIETETGSPKRRQTYTTIQCYRLEIGMLLATNHRENLKTSDVSVMLTGTYGGRGLKLV